MTTYENEDQLPKLELPIGDGVRDLMVLSYFAFASMLIDQGKVGAGDGTIVTYNELGESLAELNRAQTEADVLLHVFAIESIWRRFYIDPDTGTLSGNEDGNNFPFIQIPIDYDHLRIEDKTTDKIKELMREHRQVPQEYDFNNPRNIGVSFVCAQNDEIITYTTMLWGYAHGSLGEIFHYRHTILMHARDQFDIILAFLRGQSKPPYGLHRWFNIVEIDTTSGRLLPLVSYSVVELPTEAEAKPFVKSKILPPQKVITTKPTQIIFVDPIESSIPKASRRKKAFIITLVLFLVITALSNIFAWANIIAITAMMTKIIISGVGSVIGLICLVGTIALGYKDKVCRKCCKCKRKHLYFHDPFETQVSDKCNDLCC
jgi:hypothetical protein